MSMIRQRLEGGHRYSPAAPAFLFGDCGCCGECSGPFCCECMFAKSSWMLTVSDITNGMNPCCLSVVNGSWALSLINALAGICQWESDTRLCSQTRRRFGFLLNISNGGIYAPDENSGITLYLTATALGVLAKWELGPINATMCDGQHTLALVYSNGQCEDLPPTVIIS